MDSLSVTAKENKEIRGKPQPYCRDFCKHGIKLLNATHFRACGIPLNLHLPDSFTTVLVRKEKGGVEGKGSKETNRVQRCLLLKQL